MIKNYINARLKKEHKSQAWLSGFTGISTGMVSQLCSGRSIPSTKELIMLRAAFQCTNEDLYPRDILTIITGDSKPEQDGGKSYRGKHVLITDELASEVDGYGKRRGLTRNESARTLIILGLHALDFQKTCMEEVSKYEASCDHNFFNDLLGVGVDTSLRFSIGARGRAGSDAGASGDSADQAGDFTADQPAEKAEAGDL